MKPDPMVEKMRAKLAKEHSFHASEAERALSMLQAIPRDGKWTPIADVPEASRPKPGVMACVRWRTPGGDPKDPFVGRLIKNQWVSEPSGAFEDDFIEPDDGDLLEVLIGQAANADTHFVIGSGAYGIAMLCMNTDESEAVYVPFDQGWPSYNANRNMGKKPTCPKCLAIMRKRKIKS